MGEEWRTIQKYKDSGDSCESVRVFIQACKPGSVFINEKIKKIKNVGALWYWADYRDTTMFG